MGKLDTKMSNLDELFRGQSLSFVCPANTLVGQRYGEKIDSHDLVLRVNQYFEMPSEIADDYGKRTDVLVVGFNDHYIAEAKRNIDFLNSVKCIIVAMYHTETSRKLVFDFLEDYSIKPPVFWVGNEYINEIKKESGTLPYTAVIGLSFLLSKFGIKKILIAGMSFYEMGAFGAVYYNGYKKNPYQTPEKARTDIHDPEKIILYSRKMFKKYKDVIELDPYLKNNFQ